MEHRGEETFQLREKNGDGRDSSVRNQHAQAHGQHQVQAPCHQPVGHPHKHRRAEVFKPVGSFFFFFYHYLETHRQEKNHQELCQLCSDGSWKSSPRRDGSKSRGKAKTEPAERSGQRAQQRIPLQGEGARFLLHRNQAHVKGKGGDKAGCRITQ